MGSGVGDVKGVRKNISALKQMTIIKGAEMSHLIVYVFLLSEITCNFLCFHFGKRGKGSSI